MLLVLNAVVTETLGKFFLKKFVNMSFAQEGGGFNISCPPPEYATTAMVKLISRRRKIIRFASPGVFVEADYDFLAKLREDMGEETDLLPEYQLITRQIVCEVHLDTL